MEATDLYELGVRLIDKLGGVLFEPYLGGFDKVENAMTQLVKLTDTLLSSYWNIPLGEHHKINKKWETDVKEVLYRVENLVYGIDVFLEEGEHPNSILKSFRSSATREMELILEEIIFFQDSLPLTRTSEIVVGEEFLSRKESLVKLLLDSKSNPVIPIVGKPGSGKSTFARLAFDDARIRNHFNSKAFFISLTYTSGEDSLCYAIKCLGRGMQWGSDWPQMDDLMEQLDRAANGIKCLIILDDFRDMDLLKSLLLVNRKDPMYSAFLRVATRGTKIVITSSLELVDSTALSLPGLSSNESWSLFKRSAFPDQRGTMPTTVDSRLQDQCENIPSVINTIASIMRPKRKTEEWDHFLHNVITSIPNPITIISSINGLTELHCHHRLQKTRRHCFAWCSLLPKDYEFGKDIIFHLWRAQEVFLGDSGMTKEDLDLCFDEFITKRYFLKVQDTGLTGSVVRYKISYLVSELMKYVAGDDFCLVEDPTTEPNRKIIRHISFIADPWEPPSWLPEAKHLQSILLWPRSAGEFTYLTKMYFNSVHMTDQRTLDTQTVPSESFPVFMSEHLRLGATSFIYPPEHIPAFKRLLGSAPKKGSLEKLALYGGEGEPLALLVRFGHFKKNELYSPAERDETLWSLKSTGLTSSNPHQTLQSIKDHQWKGETIPAFVIEEVSVIFRMLISIEIVNCSGCHHLPGLDTLPNLSSLILGVLYSLVEIAISCESTEAASSNTFYPSLKCLVLCDLPQLKGWALTEADNDQLTLQQLSFPLLTEVRLKGCPELKTMPSVPMLESLEAINVNANILKHLLSSPLIDPPSIVDEQGLTEISEQHISLINTLEIDGCKEFSWGDRPNAVEKGPWHTLKSLRFLILINIPDLVSLPGGLECITTLEQLSLHWLANLMVFPEWIGQFAQLRQLALHYCLKLRTLPNFNGSFSTLEELEIIYCPRLSQFPDSFPNLKRLRVQEFWWLEQILRMSQNLEELQVENCEDLDLETLTVEGGSSVTDWEGLTNLHSLTVTNMHPLPKVLDFEKLPNLRQLVIRSCPYLITLPESLGSLSNLEYLQIQRYPGLTKFPQSFSNLKSLTKLEIQDSRQLETRFQGPFGEALIQHIPNIVLGNSL